MLLNPTLDKELPHKIISVCDYLIINVISRSARRWLPKNCRLAVGGDYFSRGRKAKCPGISPVVALHFCTPDLE